MDWNRRDKQDMVMLQRVVLVKVPEGRVTQLRVTAQFKTIADSLEAVTRVNVTTWPWSDAFEGMENHSGYPNPTRGLVAKGYSDEDIRKVMGGNHIRLVREVIG